MERELSIGDWFVLVSIILVRVNLIIKNKLLYIFIEEEEFCLVHLVNDGVVVSGNSLTIEFTGVGKVKKYFCDLDRKGLKPCKDKQSL